MGSNPIPSATVFYQDTKEPLSLTQRLFALCGSKFSVMLRKKQSSVAESICRGASFLSSAALGPKCGGRSFALEP